MIRDSRQFTRVTITVPTLLSLYQIEGCHVGAIVNISMGGCFFPVRSGLPVGEECQVTILVGEGLGTERLTLTGRIVRAEPAGVGIEFNDSSPDTRQRLEKIISRSSSCTSFVSST